MHKLFNLCFSENKLKGLLFVLIFFLVTSLVKAQDYDSINHRIDSLVKLGLPKSALTEVGKLDKLARKNKNPPQQIKSVLYRMTLQSYLEENALVPIIDSLKSDIAKASYPVKPVLQSLLGSMYYNYYQQNRWQFGQRTRLENPSADYTQWDLQTIIHETSRLYLSSLQEAKREQATPVSILDGVLQGDKSTRYLRPTLYDLLAQRALGFFLSDEPSLTKPKVAFTVNNERFFGDNQVFANLIIKTTDTESTYYQGIKLLQQASFFHLQKQDDEALGDLDIKRLEFVFKKSNLHNKDSLYTVALRKLATKYSTKPISADAWVNLGKYYQQKDSLKSAMQYFNNALHTFPESLGGHNALTLIKQVQRKELSTRVEGVNMPDRPILALLGYRNVTSVKYSIYSLSQQQYKDYKNSSSRYGYRDNYIKNKLSQEEWVNKYVNTNKPVQQKQLQLPDPHDYGLHHTEFGISKMTTGPYILYMESTNEADSTLTNYTDFQVSRLAYTSRVNPDSHMEIKVMNRETGEPLKDVNVKITSRYYGETVDYTEQGRTDKNGGMISNGSKNKSTGFELVSKGDKLNIEPMYVGGVIDNDDEVPVSRTILFTDRQIYRPGQTVYFKGLELQVIKERSTIRPDCFVDVEFKDTHYKTLSTLNLKSNEFGTFSGSFVIPQTILNGNVSIRTENGSVNFKVEEYKRPTFRVEFSPVTESYKLNDSVKVKGSVIAFSGYGLSRARVAYHITREQVYSRYSYSNAKFTEVKADTIYTNDQGQFTISYKAEADKAEKQVVYRYAINADITDASGETHTANTYVKVGNNNIDIQSNLPASIMARDTAAIPFTIVNLNNQRLNGKLQVQVYELQNPPRLLKNKLWYQKPDTFIISKNEYHSNFPFYAYGNEENVDARQQLNKLIDSTYTVDKKKNSGFYLRSLSLRQSGLYKVILKAQNLQGDTTSLTRYVNVVNPAKLSGLDYWLFFGNKELKVGGKAEFLTGIVEPINVLIEKFRGGQKVSSKWMHIGEGSKIIKVPIGLADTGVDVQIMMVFHNRVYTSNQKVNVIKPDKTLDIKMLTFRDKLQPGDKEQWKLQISSPGNEKQTAEMVAGMYDESLDDITAAAKWPNLLNQNQRYTGNYFVWQNNNFVKQQESQPLVYRNYIYQLQTREYEGLNLFGYNYFGGYNGAYHQYFNTVKSRSDVLQKDHQLEQTYKRNAELVKNGIDVTGKVVDEQGMTFPGVMVKIKGTTITTSTNSNGEFKIRVAPNGILSFSTIGYYNKELVIKNAGKLTVPMIAQESSLHEVVVIGYGTQKKSDLTGSVSAVVLRDLDTAPVKSFEQVLQGRIAGVQINGGNANGLNIEIRGTNSLNMANAPLYVVDGVIFGGALSTLSPSDIESIDILKDASATAIYGSRGANGVVVITTKSGKAKLMGSQRIIIRKNFNETAFFYPQLRTNDKGEILIDFTMPEALTKWKFRAFAHTQDLKTGYIEKEVVTQKQLNISAITPRFMREGDTITISARLANLSAGPLKGLIKLQLFNGVNMQPVSLLVNAADAQQRFDLAGSTNKSVSFKLAVPLSLEALTYRLTADAGPYSDGEENTLPVLPNRMLVTESMPMMVRPSQTKAFSFDKLINQKSTTLKSKTLTLEYTQNPAWYAVQALPYMMEFPYECSEQIFNRYFANSLGTNLVKKMPIIKQVFNHWKTINSAELTSNLERNPELKATLLEETPWLRNAISESEQKKRIALLFDLNKMSNELQLNLDKLQKRQLPDGGFSWFGGDRSDGYITRYILAGIGQIYQMDMVDTKNQTLKTIADNAIKYLDGQLVNEAERAKARKTYENRSLWSTEIHSYYVESYFTARTTGNNIKPYLADYLKLAAGQWKLKGIYEQALIAISMLHYSRPDVAKAIVLSLNETAQHTDDMGMYWAKNQLGYYWYQSPIETQSLMVELFTEVGGYEKEVEEMKIWLLRNKQTTNWKTTKATAAACYALLLKGDNWLADTGTSTIKLGGRDLGELKPNIKADAGTGYIKTSWLDEAVKPALGGVTITNYGKTVSWGAVHWQYLENLDKITTSSTDIHLQRKYFIVKQAVSGEVLTAVDAANQPKTGDLLKVVVYLKAGRDFEYIQLKDMRPAGTEPVDAISTYKYQDGLYYYQVTKDVATNLFISYLNKGNYVFEYRLRVTHPGNFSTGISTVQCMYAPEFNAHSNGTRMVIK